MSSKVKFTDEDLVKNMILYDLNQHLRKPPMKNYHQRIDASSLHEREKYKKKMEILLLNAFMHHFPEVKFQNLVCESPDFIAEIGGKKIGIELTEVINHLEKKKVEGILNKIFRKVEMQLEEKNIKKFKGVYYIKLKELPRSYMIENQDKIQKNIRKSIIKNKAVGCVENIRTSPHRKHVFITYDYHLNLFDALASDKIIELIEKKNQKFPFYDKSVEECWLIIVSDMNSLASQYSFIQNKENLKNIVSPFDKIYHLENLCGSLTTIKA